MKNENITADDISRIFTALRNHGRYLIIKFFGEHDGGPFMGTRYRLFVPLYQYMIENGANPRDVHFNMTRLKDTYGILGKDIDNRWELTEYGWIAYKIIQTFEENFKKHKKDEG